MEKCSAFSAKRILKQSILVFTLVEFCEICDVSKRNLRVYNLEEAGNDAGAFSFRRHPGPLRLEDSIAWIYNLFSISGYRFVYSFRLGTAMNRMLAPFLFLVCVACIGLDESYVAR